MLDLERLNRNKERILSAMKLRGPSLPVHIAKEIEVSPMFASAFLLELKAEGKLKISNMKVGSSPLYFLQGQEGQLEKFVEYLNQREKEAFFLLRDKRVLEDSKQSPVVRVALRAIRDFAVPVKIRVDGESRLFWKYFSLSDDEVAGFVKKSVSGKKVLPRLAPPRREGESSEKRVGDVGSKSGGEVSERGGISGGGEKRAGMRTEQKELIQDEKPLAEKKKKKIQESEFVINVKDYLGAKDIEVMHVIVERKKEFEAKIRIDTLFGKQVYYLVAKDKKNVTDNDLSLALQKARGEKLPAIVMSPGELNKKGRQHLEAWGNLVKWERLRF